MGTFHAAMAYRQAADAVTFAQSDLARVQRLFDEKLAANDQLGAARKTLADAQTQLASVQKQRGAGPAQTLTAPRAAISSGMKSLLADGRIKVLGGITTAEEIVKVAQVEGIVTD